MCKYVDIIIALYTNKNPEKWILKMGNFEEKKSEF